MAQNVNSVLRDRAIRHALKLGQFTTGFADRMVRILNAADAEIVEKIAAGLATIEERGVGMSLKARKRLEQLIADVGDLNSAAYARLSAAMIDELEQLGTNEAGYQTKALSTAITVEMAIAAPSATRLRAIITSEPMKGKILSEYLGDMEAFRIDRIGAALREGMIADETTDQLVRRIRGTKAARYSDGVLDISRRSAQSIARTAVNHVSNVTAQETWKAASNVVKGWQFLATLDTRTTTICASLDGSVHPIGSGPIPPRHIRCRSITVAVTKSFRELGVNADELPAAKRASMDGQVEGGTRFADWLRSKDEATQQKVLGKTRADLFRSNKLDLDQFTKSDGTVLTLDELKAAYKDILG